MKKKFIIINTLVSLISLFIFLCIVSIILSNVNRRQNEDNIKMYLSIIENTYNGNNEEESASLLTLNDNTIRVTFISLEGHVIYDSMTITEENHLNRPEISSIGSFVYRYSDTLHETYLYSAIISNNTIIRVAILSSSINSLVWDVFSYGLLCLVVIFILILLFNRYYYKKMLYPLKVEISKLNEIIGDINLNMTDDLSTLSFQIDIVRRIINQKILSLENETEKLNYILEHINQGLVILNGLGKIILSNKLALDLLNHNETESFNGKSYFYMFNNIKIKDDIESAFDSDISKHEVIEHDFKWYSFNIIPLTNSFASIDNKNGVSIFIQDITKEKLYENMKSDFFQNASHELKSPLTTILGYQQLIESGLINTKEELKEANENTIKETKRIDKIVKEMLDLSKLELNITNDLENINLKDVIIEILDLYKPIINEKNINVDFKKDDLFLNINHEDLNHLLRNLIDNAIKYNIENGSLKIILDDNILSITNTGEGIESRYYDRIFERFYRIDKAHSREIGGTGLGLSIVKHVCLNYNIKIEVTSEVSKYTTFKLDFSNIVIKN